MTPTRPFWEGLTPDVLVMDHLMPGLSGVELIAAVRQLKPDLPVLVVSGYAEGNEIPADLPRITKPFRLAEIATVLTALRLATSRGGNSD